jgi:membrane glycosyltransferase
MDAPRIPTQCRHYLDHLSLPQTEREAIEAQLEAAPTFSTREAMTGLHHALAGKHANPDNPALASVVARTRLAIGTASHAFNTVEPAQELGAVASAALKIAPPINRVSMVPQPWGALNPITRWFQSLRRRDTDTAAALSVEDAAPANDAAKGGARRLTLLFLMLGQTALATYYMSSVLPYQGKQPLEMAMLALFALLFCWVSAGFWTAMTGFILLARGKDPHLISKSAVVNGPIAADARTAIVMPICNEDVTRVFAGLRATYESVQKTGQLDRFDFFVLSDSGNSDICAAEVAAWAVLCKAVDGFGRIFYRRRQRRVRRKSGNIDDFCRRWGKNYRYMLVLDADSVMSGPSWCNRWKPIRMPALFKLRRALRVAIPCMRASSNFPHECTVLCLPPACITGNLVSRITGDITRSYGCSPSSNIAPCPCCRVKVHLPVRFCRMTLSKRH